MTDEETEESFRLIVDEYRDRCLWFLRSDYYPCSTAERLKVLDCIERYGDLAGYRRARGLRQWLSQSSNAASAG